MGRPPKKQKRSVVSETPVSASSSEYHGMQNLFVQTPWYSAHPRGGLHSVYNPEVKVLHFEGMTDRYKEKYKLAMEASMTQFFCPDGDVLPKYSYNKLPTAGAVGNCTIGSITKKAFDGAVPLQSEFSLVVNGYGDQGSGNPMQSGSILSFPSDETLRRGVMVNCGGVPLASVWDPETSHLYVSVVSSGVVRPSMLSTTTGKLSQLALANSEPFDSALLVYKYEDDKLTLRKSILVSRGAIVSLKRLVQSSNTAVVFSNGTCGILELSRLLDGKGLYSQLKRCPVELSLEGEDLRILCCAWTSPTTVAVGTTEGCIAEFDITKGSEPAPSVLLPLAIPSVTAIESDWGDSLIGGHNGAPVKSTSVLVGTGNMDVILVDLENPSSIIDGSKARIPVTAIKYSSYDNGFVYVDSTRSFRYCTTRDSTSNLKVRTCDEPPQCLEASNFSPLVFAGCVNGAVRLVNLYDHLIRPLKAPNASALRLYKLDLVSEKGDRDVYRMDLGYRVDNKEDRETKYYPHPDALTVTSCAVSDSPDTCNVVASTYASGLIVVETLQSIKQEMK